MSILGRDAEQRIMIGRTERYGECEFFPRRLEAVATGPAARHDLLE